MPLVETKGAGSAQGFGEFTQSAATPKYIEDVFSTYLYNGIGSACGIGNGVQLGSTGSWWGIKLKEGDSGGSSVFVDSSNNVYLAGYGNDGSSYALIAKYNSDAQLQWQRKIRITLNSFAQSIIVDGSGNSYVCGRTGLNNNILAKYDSDGNLVWSRNPLYQGTTPAITSITGFLTGFPDSFYTAGYANDGGAFYATIAEFDVSPAAGPVWQRKFRESSTTGYGIAYSTSSGALHVTGQAGVGGVGGEYAFIAKYNLSGTIQWQRKFKENVTEGRSICIESGSANIYVAGMANDGANYAFLVKYNSAGVIQWQRKLRKTASQAFATASSSSGVYIAGLDSDSNGTYAFIAKYNTSGVLQWQRSFRQGTTGAYGLAVDASGYVYVTGTANDGVNTYAYILKLAEDGSTPNSEVNGAILGDSTAIDSAGTATDSAGTATDSAGTALDAVGAFTQGASATTSSTSTKPAQVGKGGLVILKSRSAATDWGLYNSVLGLNFDLASNLPDAATISSISVTQLRPDGFNIGALAKINTNAATYVSYSFARQEKFFTTVKYSGTGSPQNISHNLNSVPGLIIVKNRSSSINWAVWHRSLASGEFLELNTTSAAQFGSAWDSTTPTASTFRVGNSNNTNQSGNEYTAYLFAHDAGGFGASGSDNVISCGSFSATGPIETINLGWEPQWILLKSATSAGFNWLIVDTMRGAVVSTTAATNTLAANTADAEIANNVRCYPTATGFQIAIGSGTWIYVAIRRGPMKTPTTGTSVFAPTTRAGTGATATVNTGILTDAVWETGRSGQTNFAYDRLRGVAKQMTFTSTNGESTYTPTDTLTGFDSMTGFVVGADTSSYINGSGINYIYWNFRRAPGFFDVVCYTGTGANRTVSHNLGVVPELMIVKNRTATIAGDWNVYSKDLVAGNVLYVNLTVASSASASAFNSTAPTANVFTVGTSGGTNYSSDNYVAYLFATCPGVSKVGSYTGTGNVLQINCGFTGGARFVLIKRTDSTGDWYVWDSARGIVAGNDPYLLLNSTAAEVTTTDWVDTYSAGFELSNAGGNNANINTATYIFLAIA